jgi:hypothetical protein
VSVPRLVVCGLEPGPAVALVSGALLGCFAEAEPLEWYARPRCLASMLMPSLVARPRLAASLVAAMRVAASGT